MEKHRTEYAGSRWYKCDLHLHTTSSACYPEKTDTPEMWVKRALDQGLDAVAVTDHNDYRGIAAIMEEGARQGLDVFPGVEITCDSSKIHMLILFDTNKNADTVRDFLNRCDIDSERIGDPDGTSLSVFEVCEIAKKRGALVIAAHIDEFNSINSMNPANLDKLLASGLLDAVQVTNLPVWRAYEADKDADAMVQTLREEYGPDATPSEVERWRKCFSKAKEAGLPMVAFSDNPCAPGNGKHGLWGIGNVYTWIQMDDDVDLESFQQSLITPGTRIRMMYDSATKPQTEPDFWIRSIEIRKTELNPHLPICLEFHPQLNCIIGGRGSGKSAIVRIFMGIYQQLPDLLLSHTAREQEQFYTVFEDNGGIFHEDSEVCIRFFWFGISYILRVTEIQDMKHQTYRLYRPDDKTGEEKEVYWGELRFRALMSAQVFTDREIHEIASVPGSLLSYMDRLIHDMYILKAKRQLCMDSLLNLSSELGAAGRFVKHEYRLAVELDFFHQMEEQGTVSEALKAELSQMISLRTDMEQAVDERLGRIAEIKKHREELLAELDRIDGEIRRYRTDFINATLKDDENYKIELKPGASRESLLTMLKETFQVDLALIREDVKKIEAALFAKKDGLKKYTGLLKKKEGFSDYFLHLLGGLTDMEYERLLLFRPEDELCLFYHPTGVKRFFPMNNASAGERVTALFSFFLFSGEMPLVIDQPEADMDNRVIYHEITAKLKKAKQQRQMILVTHNANIAANADAEMIISLESGSKFVKVRSKGTMDNADIRRDICEIIEGSEQAFLQRARRYHL